MSHFGGIIRNIIGDLTVNGDLDLTNHNINNVNLYEGRDISNLYDTTKAPSGFPNATDSTFAPDIGNRKFWIQPTGASYDFYVYGYKFTKSAPEFIVWPNVEGLHYFYFDVTGTIQTTTDYNVVRSVMLGDGAAFATLYWNVSTSSIITLGNERHDFMPGTTHLYLHECFGAQWYSGGALGGIIVDDPVPTDAGAELNVGDTVFYDEDIRYNIVNGSPQTLGPIAQLPCYYQLGVAPGNWRKVSADNFSFIYSGKTDSGYVGANGRIPYNQFTGGSWQLTEIGEGNFCLAHFFATNNIIEPIICIVGQNEYTAIGDAQTGAEAEINTLSGTVRLLTAEATPLGTIILQTSAGYGNTPKARIRKTADGGDYVDFRGNPIIGSGASASNHGNLSGLGADDHNDTINGYMLRALNATVDDNAIARWNGTTGRHVQNTLITIDDTNHVIWNTTVVTPQIYQADKLVAGTGSTLAISAQNSETPGGPNRGGAVIVTAGMGINDGTQDANGADGTLQAGNASQTAVGAVTTAGGTAYVVAGNAAGFGGTGTTVGGEVVLQAGIAVGGASNTNGTIRHYIGAAELYKSFIDTTTGNSHTLQFTRTSITPIISQDDSIVGGGAGNITGQLMTIHSQDVLQPNAGFRNYGSTFTIRSGNAANAGAGGTSEGGTLNLVSGSGTTSHGIVTILPGANSSYGVYFARTGTNVSMCFLKDSTLPSVYQVALTATGTGQLLTIDSQDSLTVGAGSGNIGGELYGRGGRASGSTNAAGNVGGAITWAGGNATGDGTHLATAGAATIRSGDATAAADGGTLTGGATFVRGGRGLGFDATGTTAVLNGGALTLAGGAAGKNIDTGVFYYGASAQAGSVTVQGGDAYGQTLLACTSGAATIRSGNAVGLGGAASTTIASDITVAGGDATAGAPGAGSTTIAGNLILKGGTASGAATNTSGNIYLGSTNVAYQASIATPTFYQVSSGIAGGAADITGIAMLVHAQDVTQNNAGFRNYGGGLTVRAGDSANAGAGGTYRGGDLNLSSGLGDGNITNSCTINLQVSGGTILRGNWLGSSRRLEIVGGATGMSQAAFDAAVLNPGWIQYAKATQGTGAAATYTAQGATVVGAGAGNIGASITVSSGAGGGSTNAAGNTSGAATFQAGTATSGGSRLAQGGNTIIAGGAAVQSALSSSTTTGGTILVNAGDASDAANSTGTVTGGATTIRGGNATSGGGAASTATGGNLILSSGAGTGAAGTNANGIIYFQTGNTNRMTLSAAGDALSFANTIATSNYFYLGLSATAGNHSGFGSIQGGSATGGASANTGQQVLIGGGGATGVAGQLATGGNMTVYAGVGGGVGTTSTGGVLLCNAGDVTGTFTVTGVGGAATVRGGNVTNVNALPSVGGKLTLQGGSATGAATTTATAQGGHVLIAGGTASGATTWNYIGNIAFHADPASWQSGVKIAFVGDCVTPPVGSPAAGGFMYSESGAGTWRGSSGTRTVFGPSHPHCQRCGKDWALEAQNDIEGWHKAVCLDCFFKAVEESGLDKSKFMIIDEEI